MLSKQGNPHIVFCLLIPIIFRSLRKKMFWNRHEALRYYLSLLCCEEQMDRLLIKWWRERYSNLLLTHSRPIRHVYIYTAELKARRNFCLIIILAWFRVVWAYPPQLAAEGALSDSLPSSLVNVVRSPLWL